MNFYEGLDHALHVDKTSWSEKARRARENLEREGYSSIFRFFKSFSVGRNNRESADQADIIVRSPVVSHGGQIIFTFREGGLQLLNRGTNNLQIRRCDGHADIAVSTKKSSTQSQTLPIHEIYDGDSISVIAETRSLFQLKIKICGDSVVVGVQDDIVR